LILIILLPPVIGIFYVIKKENEAAVREVRE